MFALPSPLSLVVSTVVFVTATFYVRRWMDDYDLPRGLTRSLLIFIVASMASYAASEVIDYVAGEPPAKSQSVANELDGLLPQVTPNASE